MANVFPFCLRGWTFVSYIDAKMAHYGIYNCIVASNDLQRCTVLPRNCAVYLGKQHNCASRSNCGNAREINNEANALSTSLRS